MKKTVKVVVTVVLLGLISGSQALAQENKTELNNGQIGAPVLSAEVEVRASGFRCLNNSCQAYLEQRRKLSKCAFCDSIMYAYECTFCGNWYPICGNGHYNTAVGDVEK